MYYKSNFVLFSNNKKGSNNPAVFVVAVGELEKYTGEADRLLRLAGTPSRMIFVKNLDAKDGFQQISNLLLNRL